MADRFDLDPADAELADRLVDLGRSPAFDADVSGAVVAAVGARSRRRARTLAIAAAALLIVVAGVVAVPGSRDTLARWFGLDRVEVEVDPDLTLPATPALPPEGSRVYDLDGRTVTVTVVDGTFDDLTISKAVASSDQVREVLVGGRPGLWFPVAHTVVFTTADGAVVSEGVAGSTLLVETDDGFVRVEGFDDLDEAVAFVEGT